MLKLWKISRKAKENRKKVGKKELPEVRRKEVQPVKRIWLLKCPSISESMISHKKNNVNKRQKEYGNTLITIIKENYCKREIWNSIGISLRAGCILELLLYLIHSLPWMTCTIIYICTLQTKSETTIQIPLSNIWNSWKRNIKIKTSNVILYSQILIYFISKCAFFNYTPKEE